MSKPDRLYIDEKDRDLYSKVEKEVFSNQLLNERKNQFLFALSIGFRNEIRAQLETREGFFRSEYLLPKDVSLINAVAIYATDSIEILSNIKEVYRIAEEYAHGGIRILHDEIATNQVGSYFKMFEKDIYELKKSLNIG
jgi:hypothetical protein